MTSSKVRIPVRHRVAVRPGLTVLPVQRLSDRVVGLRQRRAEFPSRAAKELLPVFCAERPATDHRLHHGIRLVRWQNRVRVESCAGRILGGHQRHGQRRPLSAGRPERDAPQCVAAGGPRAAIPFRNVVDAAPRFSHQPGVYSRWLPRGISILAR
jgi:hypothetical protein